MIYAAMHLYNIYYKYVCIICMLITYHIQPDAQEWLQRHYHERIATWKTFNCRTRYITALPHFRRYITWLHANHLDLDNSGSDNREGLTDSSIDAETLPSYTTPAERYARGLSSKAISRNNVEVRLLHNGERGAFATRHFSRGDFVCEYASKVLLKEESRADEERYQEAGLGSYCLDAKYQGIWYTFDATLTLKDPGRYINHASSHCNLRLMAPIMIGRGANQRLRIGFLALQEIHRGEQLFFDYGYRDQDWMVCDARKFALTGRPFCMLRFSYTLSQFLQGTIQ